MLKKHPHHLKEQKKRIFLNESLKREVYVWKKRRLGDARRNDKFILRDMANFGSCRLNFNDKWV
jgi:hypothetical protein